MEQVSSNESPDSRLQNEILTSGTAWFLRELWLSEASKIKKQPKLTTFREYYECIMDSITFIDLYDVIIHILNVNFGPW